MPLRTNLGTLLDRSSFVSGGMRSLIGAYKESHIHAKLPNAETMGYYQRLIGPPRPPWERVWYSDYSDLGSSIDPYVPVVDIRSIIVGWAPATKDLLTYIVGMEPDIYTISALIKGICSTSTQLHQYETIILSFMGGFSVIKRLITKLPDLYASVHGFDYLALSANISAGLTSYADIYALIESAGFTSADIYASITTMYISELLGSLSAVLPEDLPTYIYGVPPYDLPASLVPIPYGRLSAIIGAHPPEDIYGSLLVNPPVDLLAFIRSGYSSTNLLTAELVASGGYNNISASIYSILFSNVELPGSITPRVPVNLLATIAGWAESNITGYLYSIQFLDLYTRIIGWAVEQTSDIRSIIRPKQAGTSNLTGVLYGWISTHTSDKIINYTKFPLPPPRIILGAFGGITIFRPEIIYGSFPDLHAMISVLPRITSDLKAYIVPTIATSYDITSSIYSNTRQIMHNNLPFSFVNASFLYATLTAYSGYKVLKGFVKGLKSTSTTTASGAYWSERLYSIRPIIATTLGLAVFSQLSRSYKKLSFVNNSETPDLWAVLYGWDVSELPVYITAVPYSSLTVSITIRTLDKLNDILGILQSYHTSDITSSISPAGALENITATISAAGGVSLLAASIYPYFSTSGVISIGVSTIPFSDLRATINYSIGVLGATHSQVSPISGFINTRNSSSALLSAYIEAYTDTSVMSASVVGFKQTKLRVLNIMFRSRTRSRSDLASVIFGVGSLSSSLYASITGMHHTTDIGASITAKRYLFNTIERLTPIEVYNIIGENATLVKEIELRFGSYVPKYIYDSISKAVYKNASDKWSLRLTADTTTSSFFDKTASKYVDIDNITSYSSVDEAIRAAIDSLSVGLYSTLGATITASGGFSALASTINVLQTYEDVRLYASIMPVDEIPFLTAFIYSYSRAIPMSALIVGIASVYSDLGSVLACVRYEELGAEITGV